jgi:hypothetical protein
MSPGLYFPLPHHPPVVIRSPHNPPYEQLLVGVGVGAMVLITIVWPWWCHSSSSSYSPGAPAIHPELYTPLHSPGGLVGFLVGLENTCRNYQDSWWIVFLII